LLFFPPVSDSFYLYTLPFSLFPALA
jgi:hypothetical protein